MGKPMHILTRIVIDLATDTVVERQGYQYSGPLAECISGELGGSGSKSSTKTRSQQTSSSESGTQWNEDFLKKAMEFASGKSSTEQTPENFDPAAYLKAHPDVAGDPNYGKDPYQHWLDFGQNDPNFQFTNKTNPGSLAPTYDPAYTKGQYTPAGFTSMAPEGFKKLEDTLYSGQQSKLAQAYNQGVARQREELAQSGALNSPSQYLEGSARSSLDRSYMQNLQQAARDAFTGRLGAETTEAGRKTSFDVGEAGRQTEFNTGEAGRQTAFNEQTSARLVDLWLKKIAALIEAGRYSRGESQGTSRGDTSSIEGSGNAKASFMDLGG